MLPPPHSLLHRARLEDLFNSAQLDRRRRAAAAHNGSGGDVPQFLKAMTHLVLKLLIALHVWATLEQYEVLGMFGAISLSINPNSRQTLTIFVPGWFFGDFFMEDYAVNLQYNGIYR